MILDYMYNNDISTRIDVDFKNGEVKIINYTDDMVNRAFGVNEHPDMNDFDDFLKERCFPESRDKMKLILRDLGLDYYDPLEIIKITKGRMAEDHMWLKIIEE